MPKDKNETAERSSDPANAKDASNAAAAKAKDDADSKDEELDEELDETFPGSDAPAATRRTSTK